MHSGDEKYRKLQRILITLCTFTNIHLLFLFRSSEHGLVETVTDKTERSTNTVNIVVKLSCHEILRVKETLHHDH